jgi:hypothetical protein
MKITKLEKANNATNSINLTTLVSAADSNYTKFISSLKKCSIKYCLRCDSGSIDTCAECNKDFELYDNKCLSNKSNLFFNLNRKGKIT